MGVSAYQRVREVSESPRAMERRLFNQVTGGLIDAQHRRLSGSALADILHWNRELWAHMAVMCGDGDNGLPRELRASIISLSLWVDRHSSAVMTGRAEISDLIDVNRLIIDGLATE